MPSKNPKTLVILTLIAEQGPKTEYEFYKQKQLETMSRGTIHFCLDKLYREGYLSPLKSLEGKHKKKQFQLTFQGAIVYLNSLRLEPAADMSLFINRSLQEAGQLIKNAKEPYLKEHLGEFEKLARFLEDCGRRLDYDLFKQVPWLVDHFGHAVLYDILHAAQILEAAPPIHTEYAAMQKQIAQAAKKIKVTSIELPSNQDITKSLGKASDETEEWFDEDQMAALGQELKSIDKRLTHMRLSSESWARADSWRRAFAANFARQFQKTQRSLQLKGDLQNKALSELFSQVAKEIWQSEVAPSEKLSQIFKAKTG